MKAFSRTTFLLLTLALFAALVATQHIPSPALGTLHRRTYFYAGGELVSQAPSAVYHGQVYVEHLVPEHVTQPLPLLLVHGQGMTGTNFLNTPDGRVGWADHFLSKGWEVYIVDQPSRGRSSWDTAVDGSTAIVDARSISEMFTAVQDFGLWPQAALHTQWPGNGTLGDPIFDAFFKSTVQSLVDHTQGEAEIQAAAGDLFNKTGPVVLLTHSQGGALGWVLADAQPESVRAIVALEPSGPPFRDAVIASTPDLAWGLTNVPLAYAPPAASPADLEPTSVFVDPDLDYTCFQQGTSPPRRLVNIAGFPVLLVTSQAGVSVEHVRLEDVGILGNAHMMFMEMNNIEIAEKVVEPWLAKTVG